MSGSLESRLARLEKRRLSGEGLRGGIWFCGTEADAETLERSELFSTHRGPLIIFIGAPGLQGSVSIHGEA